MRIRSCTEHWTKMVNYCAVVDCGSQSNREGGLGYTSRTQGPILAGQDLDIGRGWRYSSLLTPFDGELLCRG